MGATRGAGKLSCRTNIYSQTREPPGMRDTTDARAHQSPCDDTARGIARGGVAHRRRAWTAIRLHRVNGDRFRIDRATFYA
jgi:hypothetical protein